MARRSAIYIRSLGNDVTIAIAPHGDVTHHSILVGDTTVWSKTVPMAESFDLVDKHYQLADLWVRRN